MEKGGPQRPPFIVSGHKNVLRGAMEKDFFETSLLFA
jgi:hypothetical protein